MFYLVGPARNHRARGASPHPPLTGVAPRVPGDGSGCAPPGPAPDRQTPDPAPALFHVEAPAG